MKIGDKVTFIPSCERDDPYTHSPKLRHENEKSVTGVIIGVNRVNHWYRVEYEVGGTKFHECFSYIPRQRRDVAEADSPGDRTLSEKDGRMKPARIRRLLTALLIGSMLLMSASGLCGQHFRTEPALPVAEGGHIDFVKGVYILRR